MPILSKKKTEIKAVKMSINQDVLDEAEQYRVFAQMDSIDDFFNEAAKFVFSKDSDWKKHKKIQDKKAVNDV